MPPDQDPENPSPITPDEVVARLRESQTIDIPVQPRPASRLDRVLVALLVVLLLAAAACATIIIAFVLLRIGIRTVAP